MIDDTVQVRVLVSQLRLGGYPYHTEEVTYRRGAILTLPEEKAISLGSSVAIIKPEIVEEPPSAEDHASETAQVIDDSILSILELNVRKATAHIRTLTDPDKIKELIDVEKAGQGRKGVLDTLQEMLEKLVT